MAIVLDDWGNNHGLLKYALEIKRPLTLSILPHLEPGRRIAEEAHENGLGVMLHLPMQPFAENQPLEPRTLLVSMSDAEIIKNLDDAVDSVPFIEGVNNHMGSRATADLRLMRLVLKRLKEKGLFFVDSNVSPKTVGPRVAKETGIAFAERNVFIDNEMNPDKIKASLHAAEKIALSRGEVIVIGHDKKMTLEVLKEMAPEIEKRGIKFVLVRYLVR